MTTAPFASTFVAIALIPVAFLFVHAFLTGRSKKRYHPISGFAAIVWDLSVSIGYMVYRTFGGAVNGETLQMTPLLMEILVLITGFWALRTKKQNRYHRLLTSPLFYIWWFAFLSGEVFYIIMYLL
ncbi:MAG: hypothetical protein ABSE15_08195 [Candidatus Bathyarchaeia archaeon]